MGHGPQPKGHSSDSAHVNFLANLFRYSPLTSTARSPYSHDVVIVRGLAAVSVQRGDAEQFIYECLGRVTAAIAAS